MAIASSRYRVHTLLVRALVAGCFSILLFSGCTNICKKSSEGDVVKSESTATATMPARETASPSENAAPSSPVVVPIETASPEANSVSKDTETNLAKIESAPAKITELPPAKLEPESRKVPPPDEKPIPPPMDLKLLEKRLKETNAIGIFTKLALKNQVDDLLDKFRAYYQGELKTTLVKLRQPYEMLIMKVLALLQDEDPKLAQDLLASREAIWKVLSDREKFAEL